MASNSSNVCRSRRRQGEPKPQKLIVVLDIDQTLVHSTNLKPKINDKGTFTVTDTIRNELLYVYRRPFLDCFLDDLHKMEQNGNIEVATYTAGTKEYADEVLHHIDPEGKIKYRFYRQDCVLDPVNKLLLKDLNQVYQKMMLKK